jgi:phytoene dehydrogenase-like protein
MNTETTTIEVDQSTAAILQALKAKAEAQGISLANLLESLAEETEVLMEKTFFERTPEERAQALLQWAGSARITAPPLSDEAISREGIYGEREDGQL